ncbi:MAG: hypothetical protein IJ015_05455 [Ruminococcus sp.]|nr:hypothetical protein [Ruminococcus sp.]
MDDKLEKKLKEFLPYIIIIGIIYLFVPAILVLTKSSGSFNQIIYIGLFPSTALLCNYHYGYKKANDILLALVAPILYIPSMLLYRNHIDSLLNCIIFLVSYFICGYIGLSLGEMHRKSKNKSDKKSSRRTVPAVVDTSVALENENDDVLIDDIEDVKSFEEEAEVEQYQQEEEPLLDPDYNYTEADVDAILAELHSRDD